MRYRLVSDDDGHKFIIPADKATEWDEFVEDPESFDWTPPEWAQELGCHYSTYTFTDWKKDA
jgi:hypothetical protein